MEISEARSRAKAKFAFFLHAAVFAAVMLLLVLIDAFTSPGNTWFIWPLMGWGIAVLLHGARVYLLPGKAEIIDAMTARELNKAGKDQSDSGP